MPGMTFTPMPAPSSMPTLTAIRRSLEQLDRVILGKPGQVRLALACILARGHLLIEDQPGVGKTTLAGALARTLGLDFGRVQFTADLLPADLATPLVLVGDAGDALAPRLAAWGYADVRVVRDAQALGPVAVPEAGVSATVRA